MNYSTTFRQHYKDKYEGLNQVYTDASKRGSEGPQGIGICALEIDSKSGLERITNWRIRAHNNHYTKKIRKTFLKLKMENIQMKVMWIPSHTNIEYNEKADQLAKQGQDRETNGTYKFNPREIWPKIKKRPMEGMERRMGSDNFD
ncbi:hypothetical protein HHI36_024382 [Cryptolaemus montrouzieri]|uniref:RNase H type-1 domain-containing protein n=1 Tax=Cryptolaemus montrouzieri TaxID=559131 RepID=A0ABD2NCN9_9CUCU